MYLGLPKLCYVCERRHHAYFTTQTLSDQWGDDWNDPLDNSGTPYEDFTKPTPKWKVFYALYDACVLMGPDHDGTGSRMGLSVESINKGMKTPWLTSMTGWSGKPTTENPISLFAGTSIYEFINTLERAGVTYGIPKEFKEYLGLEPKQESLYACCPKCQAELTSVQVSGADVIKINRAPHTSGKALFFRCPHCKVVLPGELIHDRSSGTTENYACT